MDASQLAVALVASRCPQGLIFMGRFADGPFGKNGRCGGGRCTTGDRRRELSHSSTLEMLSMRCGASVAKRCTERRNQIGCQQRCLTEPLGGQISSATV